MRRWLLALLLVLAPAGARAQAEPGANLRIYLLTAGPGDAIYERFGHNAILVRDTATRQDSVYNFGTFEIPEGLGGLLSFAWQFARGTPHYWLGEDDMQETMATFTERHRNLTAQELNLTPAQRIDLATRLAVNLRPENRTYVYDYFRDNCSTRVRDVLDAVLGGTLRRATRDHLTAHGYRYHTLRSLDNTRLIMVGIDASFGAPADQPIDQWQEMFLPQKLHDRIAELRVPGADSGTSLPLVKAELPLLTFSEYRVESAPPHWLRWLPGGGVLLALLIVLGLRRDGFGSAGRVVASIWLLVAGFAGLTLAFFWLGTNQVFTYHNVNLFFLNPIDLLLIPVVWMARPLAPSRWRDGLIGLVMVGTVVGGGLLALSLPGHQDAVVGLTAMLPTLAAAVVAGRGREAVVMPVSSGF
ncbi:MAG TPA: DUF4105 domain-containing protein [Gemmatimonadales bacterium]